jgi:pimeloyl-ACP methyl ester carboxylesterase
VSTLSVPGATLDFDVSGRSGPAVVALHGLTSSRRREELLGLDVAGGLDGVRLLRYDARGHGRSTGRDRVDDYCWPRLAEDLHLLLEHVFDGDVVHGVGGSMGTATLLHAAAARPGRFSTLTLMIPPTAWRTRAAKASEYEWSARLVETSGVGAWMAAGAGAPLPPATVGRPDTVPDVAEALLPTVLRGAASSDLPPRAALSTLDVPTLVTAWTADPAHPLTTVDALVEVLPQCRTVVAQDPEDVRGWTDEIAAHIGLPTALSPSRE